MSTPKYDIEVQLIGTDGNALSIIGLVRRAIAKHIGPAEAVEFREEAWKKGSYEELLQYVRQTVHVS